MTGMSDVLRPSAEAALSAWAARVRANREQVEQFREATPPDFYAPVAGMFRADPRRSDDPTLEVLRKLVRADDVVLDIGAGGGRLALPLALIARRVVAIDPSEGMLRVLRESLAEYSISNVDVVDSRWPSDIAQGDVALISHLGYDVEDIGPFLDAIESGPRRLCVAVLRDQPPPTDADRLWPAIHGVERAALPALPEFLSLLLARGRLFELQLMARPPQTYSGADQPLTWLRQQLWTAPEGPKDFRLQELLRERLQERDGQLALTWDPVRIGIVTWHA